jgi:predicted HTH transcriptional regulator
LRTVSDRTGTNKKRLSPTFETASSEQLSNYQLFAKHFINEMLPMPVIEKISGGVKVTVYSDKVTDKVTDNQKKILEQIKLNPQITTLELANRVGISQRKIKENIKKLKEIRFLTRIGSEKSGHWKLN